MLIHFADAPCHGKQYHSESISDEYPDGDPGHRDLAEFMGKLHRREVHYHFGFVKETATEKMIQEFDEMLLKCGGREMTIHTFNADRPPLIDEAVFRLISSSISSSLKKLSSVDKTTRKIEEFLLVKGVPNWDELKLFSVKVSKNKGTLVSLPTTPKAVKRAIHPFAKGGTRLAYRAYFPEENRHIVMKKFLIKYDDQPCIKRHIEIAIIQATAKAYAKKFCQEKPSDIGVPLGFTSCDIMVWEEDMDATQRYFSYEPYIDGDYTKFNTNTGTVAPGSDPVNETCQAFSHYTWVESNEALVVCDIQGVKREHKVILTDPAIHCKDVLIYGDTNFGARGIRNFFKSHRCNKICTRMGLEKSPHQPI